MSPEGLVESNANFKTGKAPRDTPAPGTVKLSRRFVMDTSGDSLTVENLANLSTTTRFLFGVEGSNRRDETNDDACLFAT